jgi:hypothetical protein
LLNSLFERVANSFIQALKCADFQFVRYGLFAQMPEYLTAAKYLANDAADGLVQRMRAAFPSFLHHALRFLFS